MKAIYLISIFALIAITLAGLMISTDKQSVEPVIDTIVATTTSTVSTVPSPLTLASLQALPDWNPTMAVEGMVRVEGGVVELSDKSLELDKTLISYGRSGSSKTISSGFSVRHANTISSTSTEDKNCIYPNPRGVSSKLECKATSVEKINEFIIVSDNTEVIHKYKLDEGFSLVEWKPSIYKNNPTSLFNRKLLDDFILTIDTYKWESWNDNKAKEVYTYDLNLLTGEMSLRPKPEDVIVTFTGKYTTTDYNVPNRDFEYSDNIGEDGLCHRLEVSEPFNTEALLLIDGIKGGNAVYSLNDNGELLLNLPWYEMSNEDKDYVVSDLNQPITIRLKKKIPGGHGVGACYSFYEYIEIVHD